MCTVSMIGDEFNKTVPDWVRPYVAPSNPEIIGEPWQPLPFPPHQVTRREFEALREEVSELGKLLRAAKAYDDATGQPDCETEEKLAALRKLADLMGVELGV